MASSGAPSTASIEPAVYINSTGGNVAKSSAAASQDRGTEKVFTVKTGFGVKAMRGGCGFTRSSYGNTIARWKCDLGKCGATMKTECIDGQHYLIFDPKSKPHKEEVHMRESPGPSGGRKRKEDSSADKPRETVNGVAEVPAKKSTGRRLPMASYRPHSLDTPPVNAEGAAGDNSMIGSTKGSGAGNLVDGRAAVVRRSPVHFQHARGSNEPGTSASPSGDQAAHETQMLPPPPAPARPEHADTFQNDADDGAYSYCISSVDSMNGDIEENPGAVKHQAGDVNSWDAEAGGNASLDPPIRIASYESMRNDRNAADDSAGMGLGRTQIVLNMKLETGDLRDKELKESMCRLLQAEADLLELRTELLRKERNANMAENKTSVRAAFGDFSGTL